MKFYPASRFRPEAIDFAQQVTKTLEAAGHANTFPWWDNDLVTTEEEWRDLSDKDFAAVARANVVLLLMYYGPEGRGMWMEGGYKLGRIDAGVDNGRVLLWTLPEHGHLLQPDSPSTCPFFFHRAVERLVCTPAALLQILPNRFRAD